LREREKRLFSLCFVVEFEDKRRKAERASRPSCYIDANDVGGEEERGGRVRVDEYCGHTHTHTHTHTQRQRAAT
jgi:hypothetical protein